VNGRALNNALERPVPDVKPREEWTADDYREKTVEARRQARYKFAADRIRRIIDGSPPLTDAQRARLAVLLYGGPSD
jgi:hypothetical protein